SGARNESTRRRAPRADDERARTLPGLSRVLASTRHAVSACARYPSSMTTLPADLPSADPYRTASSPNAPEPAPFEARELRAPALAPPRAIELVLSDRARLGRTLASGRPLGPLAAILVVASVLFTLPFAAVFGRGHVLAVAALYLGSVAICAPS